MSAIDGGHYLEHAGPGTHSVPDVMRSLDIPERTRNRLTKKIMDAASELAKRLAEQNVTYVPGGGRGCTSAFVNNPDDIGQRHET